MKLKERVEQTMSQAAGFILSRAPLAGFALLPNDGVRKLYDRSGHFKRGVGDMLVLQRDFSDFGGRPVVVIEGVSKDRENGDSYLLRVSADNGVEVSGQPVRESWVETFDKFQVEFLLKKPSLFSRFRNMIAEEALDYYKGRRADWGTRQIIEQELPVLGSLR